MKSWIENYIRYLREQRGLAESTVLNYLSDLDQFADFCAVQDVPITDPSQLSPAVVDGFFHYLYLHVRPISKKSTGVSSYTRRKKAAVYRGFLEWLANDGHVSRALAARVQTPRLVQTLPHVLTREDLQKLQATLDRRMDAPQGRRNAALLVLIYDHGLRISEALDLDVTDFERRDLSRGPTLWMKIHRKGQRERWLPVTERAAWYLNHHLEARDSAHACLFQNLKNLKSESRRLSRRGAWKILKGVAREAGISERLHPHSLRHTFVLQQIEAGTDLLTLKAFMDWSDLRQFDVYYHVQNLALLNVTRVAPSTRLEMIGAPPR